MVIHVETACAALGDHAAGDVHLDHAIERKTIQPRRRRKASGELVRQQMAEIEQQVETRSLMQASHEIQHVQCSAA